MAFTKKDKNMYGGGHIVIRNATETRIDWQEDKNQTTVKHI